MSIQTENILTCAYCGMAYPEGTPPHKSQVLTDHIKICTMHPLRQAEATIGKLYTALVGLVGVSSEEELKQMETVIRISPALEEDKAAILNAIQVLLEETARSKED